jgi:hypothetical protein
MKSARKRAPGGGRKRKPAKEREGEWLTTRINTAIKEKLESEAQARGYSVSRTAKEILVLGLKELRNREHDDPIRGLGFLIGALETWSRGLMVERIGDAADDSEWWVKCDWRTNPFMFQALKLAIIELMDALAPKGEIRNPLDDFPDNYKGGAENPARLARSAYTWLWDMELRQAVSHSHAHAVASDLEFEDEDHKNDLLRRAYGMVDARADLNIPQESFRVPVKFEELTLQQQRDFIGDDDAVVWVRRSLKEKE